LPWLRRLVAGLSSRRPKFDPKSFHVRSVVEKVAVGQVFLRLMWFPPVNIIPPMSHTPLHLHTALTRWTNERSLGTFQQSNAFCFSDIGETEMYFRIPFSILKRHDADGYGRIRCEIYCMYKLATNFLAELRKHSATCSLTARLAAVDSAWPQARLTTERARSAVPLSKTLFCEYSQLQSLWTFLERTE